MGVRIVTDSTSDLPAEICRELDITVVPLTVMFGDQGLLQEADHFGQASDDVPALGGGIC